MALLMRFFVASSVAKLADTWGIFFGKSLNSFYKIHKTLHHIVHLNT